MTGNGDTVVRYDPRWEEIQYIRTGPFLRYVIYTFSDFGCV